MSKRMIAVCVDCGSDEIIGDADACWDVEKQDWVVQQMWEKGGRCEACNNMDARWELIEYDTTVPDARFIDGRRKSDASKDDRVGP